MSIISGEPCSLFPVRRHWDFGALVGHPWNVPRRELPAYCVLDTLDELLREGLLVICLDEEHDHFVLVSFTPSPYTQSIFDFGEVHEQHVVDLRASEPNPCWLQDTVASP